MNLSLLQKIDRLHPYPAKFPIEIALDFVNKYTTEGDVVFDPFVGSGTTLLASSVLHRRGFGTDINHIAILISKGKLLHLNEGELLRLEEFIRDFDDNYVQLSQDVVPRLYPSVEHWFCDNSIRVLSVILDGIEGLETESEKLFAKLSMSAIINTVSNQESDTRYAAVEKPDLTLQKIGTVFSRKFRSLLSLIRELDHEDRWYEENHPCLLDAKKCGEIIDQESVDLILTSPPYVNTYDYYLYHKHRMNWLGYDVKYSMDTEIGSRREYSSLKHSADKFSDDLRDIFQACDKVLKKKGKVVLIIGDGKVAGEIYDAKERLVEICLPIGWHLIDYSYTNLDVTSRSFQQSYRTKGKKEHILVFEK